MVDAREQSVAGRAIDPLLTGGDCPELVTWTFSGTYDENKPILIDAANPSRFLTRTKAQALVAQLAGAFEAGSTVCLHLPNDILYPVLVLSILASRCKWTGTNPVYTAPELQHHFRLAETKYVVTNFANLNTIHDAVAQSGTGAEIIILDDLIALVDDTCPQSPLKLNLMDNGPISVTLLSSLLKAGPDAEVFQRLKETPNADSYAVLMQTSGTTGLPKMAARTHRAMVTELEAIADSKPEKDYEIRRLFSLPIFHGFALPEMVFNSIRYGQTTYVMGRFIALPFVQYIKDYGITETAGAPVMFQTIINQPEYRPLVQSIRYISYGGAPMGTELRRKIVDFFNETIRIVPVYGMTEIGWMTSLKHADVNEAGSVGRPLRGCEMKVMKDETYEFLDQEVGELMARTPQLMAKYLGNEKATSETIAADGWLHTGDIGYISGGMVYIIDRGKDLIKVNGWQVAPAELENAVSKCDGVLEVAVIGAGEGLTEHPVIFVVRQKDSNITGQMIKEHMAGSLTKYKYSSAEFRFVESIPKSPSGKILKPKLRELLRAEMTILEATE